jgi:hypothetical protein
MVKLSYIQFDRLLIAQSQVEKMTLATVDGAFVGEASPWRIDMRSIEFRGCLEIRRV